MCAFIVMELLRITRQMQCSKCVSFCGTSYSRLLPNPYLSSPPPVTKSWRRHRRLFILRVRQPSEIPTGGPPQRICSKFSSEVGRRLTSLSGDSRETSFLFRLLSMLIQRFNSALITDSFCFSDEDRFLPHVRIWHCYLW